MLLNSQWKTEEIEEAIKYLEPNESENTIIKSLGMQ